MGRWGGGAVDPAAQLPPRRRGAPPPPEFPAAAMKLREEQGLAEPMFRTLLRLRRAHNA